MTYTFKLARRLAVSRTLGMLRPDALAVQDSSQNNYPYSFLELVAAPVVALTRGVAKAAPGVAELQEPAPPKRTPEKRGAKRGSPRNCRRALEVQVEESRLGVEKMEREWRRFRKTGEIALILFVLWNALAAYSSLSGHLTWVESLVLLGGPAGLPAIAWGLFRQSNRYLGELSARQEVYDAKRNLLDLFDLLGGGPASVQAIPSMLLKQ